ncbi:MAG: 30S ribosomal protein S20 [Oscillibacter sp.]|nr:30S ribosomal protein S20 [Oscillibacter sp.]
MPNIKSAKKRDLIGKARNARNRARKSDMKTAVKKFEAAAAEGDRSVAETAYRVAVKKVDQAVARGVLHKNAAAHKKSAMTLKLNQVG